MYPEEKRVRKATRPESVMNSALWHLGQKDLTQGELLAKLRLKTDNEDWIAETLEKLRGFGYLKSDSEFAVKFSERAFANEYGSGYILAKLKKKGLDDAVIRVAIERVKQELQIDEQTILNERVNSYYQTFNVSKEKLSAALQKRGFSYAQVDEAIKQHACFHQLKTNLEIKAEKADLEKEVLKYARKGKGMTVIRQELRQRKIDITNLDALIEKLVNAHQLDFYSSCLEQLEKKPYDLSSHKERGKAYAMLSRKGFSSDEIQFALSELS